MEYYIHVIAILIGLLLSIYFLRKKKTVTSLATLIILLIGAIIPGVVGYLIYSISIFVLLIYTLIYKRKMLLVLVFLALQTLVFAMELLHLPNENIGLLLQIIAVLVWVVMLTQRSQYLAELSYLSLIAIMTISMIASDVQLVWL